MRTHVTDLSTLFGIAIAFTLVAAAIFFGGNPKGFIDTRSVLIVIAGTLAITLACFSFSEVIKAVGLVARTIFYTGEDPKQTALLSLKLAEMNRKEGILGLDRHENLVKHNPFLRKGINMLADGNDIDKVEKTIREEMRSMVHRHKTGISIIKKAAEIAPAMGLIGTLIGLVQMLGNLNNPSSIGPAMAVALLTTLYGVVLAFMVLSPLASKLERNNDQEVMTAEIYLQTINSIACSENPRQLELMINSILPPTKRVHYFD